MPPARLKPPKEKRAEIEQRFIDAVHQRWPTSHDQQARFFMRYFTSLDLIGITAELEDPETDVTLRT